MHNRFMLIAFAVLIALTACGEDVPVIHDLSSTTLQLVDADSSAVNFPADFKDDCLVVGFIYTHCPDICPVTTANMKNVFDMLNDTSDVQFIVITFDPRRDTPSVLKTYKQNFRLPDDQFTMLTGDSIAIDSVLSKMDIQAKISFSQTDSISNTNYFMNHTDRISVMDTRGRVRFEYPGSRVPPEHIVEDLNKIR